MHETQKNWRGDHVFLMWLLVVKRISDIPDCLQLSAWNETCWASIGALFCIKRHFFQVCQDFFSPKPRAVTPHAHTALDYHPLSVFVTSTHFCLVYWNAYMSPSSVTALPHTDRQTHHFQKLWQLYKNNTITAASSGAFGVTLHFQNSFFVILIKTVKLKKW